MFVCKGDVPVEDCSVGKYLPSRNGFNMAGKYIFCHRHKVAILFDNTITWWYEKYDQLTLHKETLSSLSTSVERPSRPWNGDYSIFLTIFFSLKWWKFHKFHIFFYIFSEHGIVIVLQEETQQIQRKDNFFLQNVKHISESIFNDVLNFQCDEDKLSQGTRIYINL